MAKTLDDDGFAEALSRLSQYRRDKCGQHVGVTKDYWGGYEDK